MNKSVVTGGAGFIGSHLVDALVARGDEVHVVDTFAAGRREERLNRRAHYHQRDVTKIRELDEVFAGADVAFHLAALPRVQHSIQHPQETNLVNLGGTMNVLAVAHRQKVRRVVFAASSSAYGDQERLPLTEDMPAKPMSPYALQKYLSEDWCRVYATSDEPQYVAGEHRLETVSLRFFNVYGPRLDPEGPYALVLGVFLRQKRAGKPLTITGGGTQTRDFTHVSDIVRACLRAADSPRVGRGEVINVGAGRNISINELARMFGGPVAHIAPRVEPHDTRAGIEKAKVLLGWEPTVSIEDGVAELLRSNY